MIRCERVSYASYLARNDYENSQHIRVEWTVSGGG